MAISKKSRAFTLIELLVVISIIALLSSIVLSSLNTARAKARDARKIGDFRQISLALTLYYDKFASMPANPTPGTEVCDGSAGYTTVMNDLISNGFLGAAPRSPGGAGYCYYNYGAGGIGGLLVTTLEAAPDTLTGIPPSCRPWAPPANNWCMSTVSSKQYCLCNPQ